MKIYLAAFECVKNRIRAMENVKPYFVLGSFYYLNKLEPDYLERYMDFVKNRAQDFILDSGAFSMLNTSKNDFLSKLENYVNSYIEFINKYDVRNFIELDIDKLVGYEKVKQIRSKIEIETRKKCIPVWHMSRGIEEYRKMCEEYDYIAIGGIAIKDIKAKDYKKIFPPLLKIARQNKCNVHGLGFTGAQINKFNFYSVDSSTWTGFQRFAQLHKYDPVENYIKIKKISDKQKMKNDKETIFKLAIHTLKEWKKLQIASLKKEKSNEKNNRKSNIFKCNI